MFSASEYIFLSHFLAWVADSLTDWPAGWLTVILTSWLSGFTTDYIIGQIIIWLFSLTQKWKFSATILIKTSIQQEYEMWYERWQRAFVCLELNHIKKKNSIVYSQ